MNEQIINKNNDNLIINNGKLIYFSEDTIFKLNKKYNFSNSTIYLKDNNQIYKYDIGLIFFHDLINIDGINIKCLIQANKYYNQNRFYRLFNEKFFYGNITGITYSDNFNYNDIILMDNFNLE